MFGIDKKFSVEKLIQRVILLFGMTFLFFLFQTAWNVRPCSDDLFFYSEFLEKGWFHSIWEMNTNIRFTGFLLFNTLCLFASDFTDLSFVYFAYYTLLFSLLAFSILRFLKSIQMKCFVNAEFSILNLISATFLMILSFYFSTINAQEVWFWTIATTIYLFPIALLFLALSEFFKENSIFSRVKIFVLFLLIGGTVENLVLSLFLVLFFCFVFQWKNQGIINRKLILSLVSLPILPMISMIHNGLNKRMANEQYYRVKNGFFDTIYSDFDFKINFNRILLLLLIYILVYFMGSVFNKKGLRLDVPVKRWMRISLLLLATVFLSTFIPMIVVFGNLGPARASMPFIFLFNILILFWVLYVGNKFQFQSRYFVFPALLGLFMIGVFTFKQHFITKDFSQAYDERIEFIKSQKNPKERFILVSPLPDSGVIPTQEANKIGDNPAMTSYYLGRLNGVDKDVYLK